MIALHMVVSEMTYTVSSGTLNSSIPYHRPSHELTLSLLHHCMVNSRIDTDLVKIVPELNQPLFQFINIVDACLVVVNTFLHGRMVAHI